MAANDLFAFSAFLMTSLSIRWPLYMTQPRNTDLSTHKANCSTNYMRGICIKIKSKNNL